MRQGPIVGLVPLKEGRDTRAAPLHPGRIPETTLSACQEERPGWEGILILHFTAFKTMGKLISVVLVTSVGCLATAAQAKEDGWAGRGRM